MRQALEEAYGGSSGKVSLARAALRWLNHHSKLQSESGGSHQSNVQYTYVHNMPSSSSSSSSSVKWRTSKPTNLL